MCAISQSFTEKKRDTNFTDFTDYCTEIHKETQSFTEKKRDTNFTDYLQSFAKRKTAECFPLLGN